MTRVICALILLAAGGELAVAQAPVKPPAEMPDESALPEEDESFAPKKYVLNPLESKRNMDIGDQYFRKGKYVGALSRYKDATGYNPSSPEAFLKLGETEEKLHHDAAAKAAFQKVMKLAPDSKFAAEAKKKLASIKG